MGWRWGFVGHWLALGGLVCNLGQALPSCLEVKNTFQKCVESNPRYGKYADLLYDCDDYATYCNEVMGALYFQYTCEQSGKKASSHAINKISCTEDGVDQHCLLEPQSGRTIACWPTAKGKIPPAEPKRKLCEAIELPKGKITHTSEYAVPRGNVHYDTTPRACSDWHGWVWGGSFNSCWNCCLTEANEDGRPNVAWLNQCKVYCWGLPGTPPGQPPQVRLQ